MTKLRADSEAALSEARSKHREQTTQLQSEMQRLRDNSTASERCVLVACRHFSMKCYKYFALFMLIHFLIDGACRLMQAEMDSVREQYRSTESALQATRTELVRAVTV